MRIFTAIRHAKSSLFYGDLWTNNFYPALTKLGHEIVESQVDLLPLSKFMNIEGNFTPQELQARDEITDKIIEEVRQEHRKQPIQIFLSYFYNSHFNPDAFEEIHRLGIPTINFYCNNIHQFKLVKDVAKKVKYSWHSEKDAVVMYREINANPVWVQMAGDPEVYKPIANLKKKSSACFVGQQYADRMSLLAAIAKAEIPLSIYGKGWGESPVQETPVVPQLTTEPEIYLGRKQVELGTKSAYWLVIQENLADSGLLRGLWRTVKQFLIKQDNKNYSQLLTQFARGYAESIPHIFSEYEVVLNFSNVWADGRAGSRLIPHVRLRDFEAPLCRSCYLTGYSEEIAEYYVLGQEIDTYTCAEELVDKVRFYLTHPEVAGKLREAGYQRAIRDHTWEKRFQELFSKIEIN